MNMANTKTKKDMLDADIIAIGEIKYDTDTGEIEKFKSLIPNYIRGSSLIFLVYDVTNKHRLLLSKA